jgi:integrase
MEQLQLRRVKGTKKEADKRLTELLREIDTGTYLDPSRMTVANYLQSWLKDYAEPNVSAKTYSRYEEICNKHLIPALGRIELQKLKPFHIQEYYNEALKSGLLNGKGGLSAQTVKHHHRVLSESMKKAVRWQLINHNPCDAVDAPKPEKKEMRALDEKESAVLLDAAQGTRLYYPVLITITTGLRCGELIGLKWADVNFASGSLSVNRTIEQTRISGVIEKTPKTKKSRRLIALADIALSALKALRKEQSEQKLRLGPLYQDKGYLFANDAGALWKPEAFTKAFQRLVKKNRYRTRSLSRSQALSR